MTNKIPSTPDNWENGLLGQDEQFVAKSQSNSREFLRETLQAQDPANGVMMVSDQRDWKYFKVNCECDCDDHQHSVIVETTKDQTVEVTITTVLTTGWINRFKLMWQLLTTGRVEVSETILMNKQQALNYSATLTKAVESLSN